MQNRNGRGHTAPMLRRHVELVGRLRTFRSQVTLRTLTLTWTSTLPKPRPFGIFSYVSDIMSRQLTFCARVIASFAFSVYTLIFTAAQPTCTVVQNWCLLRVRRFHVLHFPLLQFPVPHFPVPHVQRPPSLSHLLISFLST